MDALITKTEMIVALLPEYRQTLAHLGKVKQFAQKGRDIVQEGEKPEHIYVIIIGWAARYKLLQDGSRQITAFLLPGDLCNGEITILRKMDHGVVALTPVTVAAIERDVLIAGTRGQPKLAEAFWRATLIDAAVLRAWVANIGRRSSYQRVGHLICELHARLSALGLCEQKSIACPLTQQDLGDALGLTSVHVSRVLTQLRDEEVVCLQNRILTLFDAKRLDAIAGFKPDYLHLEAA